MMALNSPPSTSGLMNINLERVLILLVIGVFTATSLSSLTSPIALLTTEKATEISKKAELVRDGIATSRFYQVSEVTYHNSTWVALMKKGHNKEMYARVPEGHGIWQVVWVFTEFPISGYTVIVTVDAETGRIAHETLGIGFG